MKGITIINLYIREVNVPDFVKQILLYIKVLVDRDTIISKYFHVPFLQISSYSDKKSTKKSQS
jgi:hypothetical protein